jgi:hypothetical protein
MQKFDLSEFLCHILPEFRVDDFLSQIDTIKPTEDGPWLCGGALRSIASGEKIRDFDVFFKSLDQMHDYQSRLISIGFVKSRQSDNAAVFTRDGFVVNTVSVAFYNSIDDVISSFDFTISMFGTDGKHLYCGDYALFDTGRKKLALNKLTYPTATLRRLLKYSSYGYATCDGMLHDLLTKVVDSPQLLENKFEYID